MEFGDEFLKQVKENNDIIDVAKSYFDLQSAGRNYKAHCTHPGGDKTPSLTFFPDTQRFRCFSCNVGAKTHPIVPGSDVFALVQWLEGFGFPEAIEFLAKRAGIPIPEPDVDPVRRQALQDLLDRNHQYWYNLQSDLIAQAWYKSRGISEESIKAFRLGSELHEPVYAIQDLSGATVSFVKRHETGSKYVNDHNSDLFQKGKSLYGLYQSKPLIRKHRFCFVVEGYNDAIILIQAGYPTVAIMSGILTSDQANLLARYTKNVVLFPDGDAPGLDNIQQNTRVLQQAGMEIEILFSHGSDPDEIVIKYGDRFDQFFQENRQLVFHYVLERILSRYRSQVLHLKQEAIQEVNRWIDDIQDPTQKELYVTTILASFRREEK